MATTVFVGPSLAAEECVSALPGAVLRPPAEQGDLLHAVEADGADVLVLIDGTFHQNLSVWHSEVCFLLSRGITIFGASSMGALRAAETATFGMIGVGKIYSDYRDGTLVADDEVALLHGDAETGYRSLSIPLVNIRASLAAAVAERRLGSRSAARALAAAAGLYYPHRTLPTLLEKLAQTGMSRPTRAKVADALSTHFVDQKRIDALECLSTVAAYLQGRWVRPPAPQFEFLRSSVFETLYHLDRRVPSHGSVRLEDVATYAAVQLPEYPTLRVHALHRELVVFLGMLVGVKATPEEITAEATRFRQARHLTTDEDLNAWLAANAMSEADLGEYLAQEAICRTLRTWIAFARGFDRGLKPVLDELRALGQFDQIATECAEATRLSSAFSRWGEFSSFENVPTATIAAMHATRGHAQITGDARVWAHENGFEGVDDLASTLRLAFIADDVKAMVSAFLASSGAASRNGKASTQSPEPIHQGDIS